MSQVFICDCDLNLKLNLGRKELEIQPSCVCSPCRRPSKKGRYRDLGAKYLFFFSPLVPSKREEKKPKYFAPQQQFGLRSTILMWNLIFSSAHLQTKIQTKEQKSAFIHYKMGVYFIKQMFKSLPLRLKSCKVTKRKYFQCLSLMNEEALILSSYINLDQELCTPVCFKVFKQVIGTQIE